MGTNSRPVTECKPLETLQPVRLSSLRSCLGISDDYDLEFYYDSKDNTYSVRGAVNDDGIHNETMLILAIANYLAKRRDEVQKAALREIREG